MDSFWQNNCKSLKDRNLYLFQTGLRADCSFQVGLLSEDQRLFKAHKFILASVSPFFETMFFGSLPEDGNQPIKFDDIDSDDFNDVLLFMYNEEIKFFSFEKALQIYIVADRFMAQQLMKKCIAYLETEVNSKNVIDIYEFSKQFDEMHLNESCVEIIRSKTSEVISSTSFLRANISFLNFLFLQDELQISSELDLFFALQNFANVRFSIDERHKNLHAKHENTVPPDTKTKMLKEGNQIDSSEEISTEITENKPKREEGEQELKDAKEFLKIVKRIRFLTLTAQEFAKGPGMSNLLTSDDALAIAICIIDPTQVEKHFPKNYCSLMKSRKNFLNFPLLYQK